MTASKAVSSTKGGVPAKKANPSSTKATSSKTPASTSSSSVSRGEKYHKGSPNSTPTNQIIHLSVASYSVIRKELKNEKKKEIKYSTKTS